MVRKREPLAVRMDARRATVDAATVARLEEELRAVREREETYREAWREVATECERLRGEALVYKRAARRRYMVMLRLAAWARRATEERDRALSRMTEAIIDRDTDGGSSND